MRTRLDQVMRTRSVPSCPLDACRLHVCVRALHASCVTSGSCHVLCSQCVTHAMACVVSVLTCHMCVSQVRLRGHLARVMSRQSCHCVELKQHCAWVEVKRRRVEQHLHPHTEQRPLVKRRRVQQHLHPYTLYATIFTLYASILTLYLTFRNELPIKVK